MAIVPDCSTTALYLDSHRLWDGWALGRERCLVGSVADHGGAHYSFRIVSEASDLEIMGTVLDVLPSVVRKSRGRLAFLSTAGRALFDCC